MLLQARQAVILGAVLLVALSPHYPWYFGWLAPLACLAPLPSVLWMLAAAPLLAHGAFEYLAVPGAVYVPGRDPRGDRSLPPPASATASRTERAMTVVKDPRRYFEAVQTRATQATAPPVCLYLEVTNRCNLLCETCPRTFETLEPPADGPDRKGVWYTAIGMPLTIPCAPSYGGSATSPPMEFKSHMSPLSALRLRNNVGRWTVKNRLDTSTLTTAHEVPQLLDTSIRRSECIHIRSELRAFHYFY